MDPEQIMANTYQIKKRKDEYPEVSRDLDECESYGAFVVNKMRSYSNVTKTYVQHHICNILFHADRGKYEYQFDYGYSTSQDYSSTTQATSQSPTATTSRRTSTDNCNFT